MGVHPKIKDECLSVCKKNLVIQYWIWSGSKDVQVIHIAERLLEIILPQSKCPSWHWGDGRFGCSTVSDRGLTYRDWSNPVWPVTSIRRTTTIWWDARFTVVFLLRHKWVRDWRKSTHDKFVQVRRSGRVVFHWPSMITEIFTVWSESVIEWYWLNTC